MKALLTEKTDVSKAAHPVKDNKGKRGWDPVKKYGKDQLLQNTINKHKRITDDYESWFNESSL